MPSDIDTRVKSAAACCRVGNAHNDFNLHLVPSAVVKFSKRENERSFAHICLKNPTPRFHTFRIHTTLPQNFVANPNSGVLGPGEFFDIKISYRPPLELIMTHIKCDAFAPKNCLMVLSRPVSSRVPKASDFVFDTDKVDYSFKRLDVDFAKLDEGKQLQPLAAAGESAKGHSWTKYVIVFVVLYAFYLVLKRARGRKKKKKGKKGKK